MRHRRRALGWCLIALAVLPLLPALVAVPFFTLSQYFIIGAAVHSWAAMTGLLLIAIALFTSGAYLLRTEGHR